MEGLTSMRRALVFLLLGPTLIACAVCLFIIGVVGPCAVSLAPFLAAIFFLFACLISAIAKPIDLYLAEALPMSLRAPLIAIIGATIALGSILALIGIISPLPPVSEIVAAWWIWWPFALTGAYCAGLCSLLSGESNRETWASP